MQPGSAEWAEAVSKLEALHGRVEFDPVRHEYRVDDGRRRLPVTSVLRLLEKPGLTRWRGAVGNNAADAAMVAGGETGTAVHEHCATLNRLMMAGETPALRGVPMTEDVYNAVSAYLGWAAANIKGVLAVELRLFSDKLPYVGTCDLVALLVGHALPAVADIKSGKAGPGPLDSQQVAAYDQALIEQGALTDTEAPLVIWTPRDGKPAKVQTYDGRADDFGAFQALLQVACWIEKRGGKGAL